MVNINGHKAEEVLSDFQSRGKIDPRPYLLIIGKRENMNGLKGNHFDRLQKLFEIQRILPKKDFK